MANKMDIVKIIRIKRVKKPNIGFNSYFLVMCNHCHSVFGVWDTEMYNKSCPCCKNTAAPINESIEDLKQKCWNLNRRLFSEYKTSNVLTSRENTLLSNFRESLLIKDLEELILNHWFLPSDYKHSNRRKQWCITPRGRKLLENPDFIDLLQCCYKLIKNN